MFEEHETQASPTIAAVQQNPDALTPERSVAVLPRSSHADHLRHRKHHHRKSGRLWQLPESSIAEYAKWIEQKPVADQTVSEQKLLWKYQRRVLLRQNKVSKERLKDYVARLEQKEVHTPVEERLIHQFHRRRVNKSGVGIPPPIFWRRNRKTPPPSPSLLTNMTSLRESMNKLGLSSDKLRDANMQEDSK